MAKRRVIELIRVSTEAQAADDRASIAAQRAVNRSTAAQFGLEIAETIEMADVSGTAVLQTPEIQRLLIRLASPDLNGVVCREFSRLMRPERFADYVLLAAFQDNRKALYLPDGPVDFATRQGMLVGGIRALMAGHERAEMLERAWTAKEAMRRQGRSPNGRKCLPYGVLYDRATGKWSYEPEKAQRVREVFKRFLAGDTNYNALSQRLGVSRGAAKYILTNPIYTGWLVVDEKRDLSPEAKRVGKNGRQTDRRRIARTEDEVIRVRVLGTPLIRQVDFDRVQRLVNSKATAGIRQRKQVGKFVYNGFLRCGECGALLHSIRNQFNRFYYFCSSKKRRDDKGGMLCASTPYMNRDKLERILDELISQKLRNRGVLKSIAEEQVRRHKSRSSQQRVRHLEDEIAALEARRERVLEAFIDGALSKEQRDQRLATIGSSVEKAQTELAAVRPTPTFDPEALADVFAPFRNWDLLGRADKRRMLSAISPEFAVTDYKVSSLKLLGIPVDINKGSRSRMGRSASRERRCR